MGKVFLELSGAKIILKIIHIHEATLPISLLSYIYRVLSKSKLLQALFLDR